jgi:signal transduction histidine kinase
MTLREPALGPVPSRSGPLRPITGILLERILGRCLAVFTVVFGLQGLPFAIMQQSVLKAPFSTIVVVALFGSFVATIAAGFAGRFLERVAPFVPIIYLVAMAVWPLSVRDPAVVQPSVPWLWFVCNLVLAVAVFAFRPWVAALYIVVIPGVFFTVRLTPSGGGVSIGHALLDASYTFILGLAGLVLVVLLRKAAHDLDSAQGAAVARYGEAVREHATEVERIQVDSIVHDGVLTALLSASKADTDRSRRLAAVMAETSMARLVSAAEEPRANGKKVPLDKVWERLDRARGYLDPETRMSPQGDSGTLLVPADIAQTLADAAVQALVNSCQHAGDEVQRWISVVTDGPAAVVIVGDAGAGFDTSVPSERLGVRVSILERVENCGGSAEIVSAPGRGTVVTLRWPAAASAGSSVQQRTASLPE